MNKKILADKLISDYDIPSTSVMYYELLENVITIMQIEDEKSAREYIEDMINLYGSSIYF